MTPAPRATLRMLVTLIVLSVFVASCSDGTPGFCRDLNSSKQLDGIVAALKKNDLKRADSEARRLKDLAAEAPGEIRTELEALADGVVDIIDLVKRDQDANSVATANSSETGGDDTQDDTSTVNPPSTEPTDVEQRRNELNFRLGELDKTSDDVSNWALKECGIEL